MLIIWCRTPHVHNSMQCTCKITSSSRTPPSQASSALSALITAFTCLKERLTLKRVKCKSYTVMFVVGPTSYAQTDYVLMCVLDGHNAQRWIVVSYDIWCQFHINLTNRITKHFPDQLPVLNHVHGAVPKMLFIGHSKVCQLF